MTEQATWSRCHSIRRLHAVCERSTLDIGGTLEGDRLADAYTALANAVHAYEGDTDELWVIGEDGAGCLPDMLEGAHEHYAQYHAGQWSAGYRALSALSQVCNPGIGGGPTGSTTYDALAELART